jgi:hypothetical protein
MSILSAILERDAARKKLNELIILGFIIAALSIVLLLLKGYEFYRLFIFYKKLGKFFSAGQYLAMFLIPVNLISIALWIKINFNLQQHLQNVQEQVTAQLLQLFQYWLFASFISCIINIICYILLLVNNPFIYG